jgi:hypothetical protein
VASLVIVFGGPVAYLVGTMFRLTATVETAHALFWHWVLAGAVAVMTTLIRSPGGLAQIWPILALILDVDAYLRDDEAPEKGARAAILGRGLALLHAIEHSGGPSSAGVDGILVVSHSQGTVIAADLLATRALLRGIGKHATILLTMGSPLRALYQALLPFRVARFLRAPGCVAEMDVKRWHNAYFAGDLVGRSLWRAEDERGTYTDPYSQSYPQGAFTEECFGAGGHMGYWSSPRVAETVLELLRAFHDHPQRTWAGRQPAKS